MAAVTAVIAVIAVIAVTAVTAVIAVTAVTTVFLKLCHNKPVCNFSPGNLLRFISWYAERLNYITPF